MDPRLFELFAPSPDSLDLYLSLEEKLREAVPGVEFRVQKTQVSFYLGHMFGCASLLPVVPKGRRPQPYLTVTFGLREPLDHPRVAGAGGAPPWPVDAPRGGGDSPGAGRGAAWLAAESGGGSEAVGEARAGGPGKGALPGRRPGPPF